MSISIRNAVACLSVALVATFTVTKESFAALLVGDWGNKAGGINDVIMEFDGTTGVFVEIFASGGGLDAPNDLKFGPDGNLYVASAGSDNILRYDGMTGSFINVASGGGIEFPFGLEFGPDKNLYVTNPLGIFADTVLRYDGSTGAFIDVFSTGAVGGRHLIFGPDENLYVVSNHNGSVLRYDGLTGNLIDTFVSNAGVGAFGIAFGPDGNLYVSNRISNEVRKFDGATGTAMGVFASFGLNVPTGIAFGADGNLYVGNENGRNVTRYSGLTGQFISIFASGNNLAGIHAIAFTPKIVPSPSALWLLGSGLFCLLGASSRRSLPRMTTPRSRLAKQSRQNVLRITGSRKPISGELLIGAFV